MLGLKALRPRILVKPPMRENEMGTAYEDVYRDDKILGMTTGFEFCYLLFHIMLFTS